MRNGSHHPVSLWVVAFALTSALQVFRGAIEDIIIFVGGGLIILASTTIGAKFSFPSSKLTAGFGLDWAGLILLVALAFSPRHSFFDLGLFVLLLPVALTLAWGEHSEPTKDLTHRDRSTRKLWSAWAITMCLWEFAANILGQVSGVPDNFPTISVLVDPLLNYPIGQAGFTAVWLLVGYYVLKAGSE